MRHYVFLLIAISSLYNPYLTASQTVFLKAFNKTVKKIPRYVFFFDLDKTVTMPGQVPTFTDLIPFIGSSLMYQPSLVLSIPSVIWNIDIIAQQGRLFAKLPNATTESTIKQSLEWLKAQGYGDFTSWAYKIGKITVNPQPIKPMIRLARKLRSQGHMVIAATAHDALNHEHYSTKLKDKHNINLDTLFNFRFTAYAQSIAIKSTTKLLPSGNYQVAQSVFMAPPMINKPHPDYFISLFKLLEPSLLKTHTFIFIDDDSNNVQTFNTLLANLNMRGQAIQCCFDNKTLKENAHAFNAEVARIERHIRQLAQAQ